MYMYMYTYMCLCIGVYVYMCIDVYVYMCVYVYVCMRVSVHVCMCVCVHVLANTIFILLRPYYWAPENLFVVSTFLGQKFWSEINKVFRNSIILTKHNSIFTDNESVVIDIL